MKSSTLQKIGGIAIISGAFLLTLWTVCWTFLLPIRERFSDYSLMILNPNWIWITAVSFVGIIFMIFGFTAAYARMYDRTGITGLVGYVFIIFAYLLQAAKVTWEHFIYPVLTADPRAIFLIKEKVLFNSHHFIIFRWLSDIAIFAGVVLFCISIVRSKDFGLTAAILIFVGAVSYGIGPMINTFVAIGGVIILSAGCVLIGLKMITGKG